jgi:hypothetical protein
MANMNLKVTIPASGKVQISSALPRPTGGDGQIVGQNLTGNIFAQQLIFQNQGANPMFIGDATTTTTNGLMLGIQGTANFGAFINYGTYLSDWFVAGTPGDTLFLIYIA